MGTTELNSKNMGAIFEYLADEMLQSYEVNIKSHFGDYVQAFIEVILDIQENPDRTKEKVIIFLISPVLV